MHPHRVPATSVLASSLAFIDGSVVNAALPAIARSVPSHAICPSWIVSGYLLPLSALLMTRRVSPALPGARPWRRARRLDDPGRDRHGGYSATAAGAAPTNAVLSAVDARHCGIASGFNSVVARTGGLIATALASAILVAHAEGLESAFHVAMLVGAATAAAASATAFLGLPSSQAGRHYRT